MPHYVCKITETLGKTWPTPGTTTRRYSYDGDVNMDGYFDRGLDSTRHWSCKMEKNSQ